MKTGSFRLEEKQYKEIEAYAKRMKIDKSSAARRLLEVGLKEIKKNEAIDRVRKHEWTLWKAANYCDMSYRSFLGLLRKYNVPFPLSVDELVRELNDDSSE